MSILYCKIYKVFKKQRSFLIVNSCYCKIYVIKITNYKIILKTIKIIIIIKAIALIVRVIKTKVKVKVKIIQKNFLM